MKSTESKIWRNWQILLPYEVCDEMRLKPGDFIRFVRRDEGIILEKIEG